MPGATYYRSGSERGLELSKTFEATVTYRISTENDEADMDEVADFFRDALEEVQFFISDEEDEEHEYNAETWGGVDIRELQG